MNRIVFVEYRIKPEYVERYLNFIAGIQRLTPSMQLFEGEEQPHLFVEIWQQTTMEQYRELQLSRRDTAHPEWGTLLSWIEGGHHKLHIWSFIEKNLPTT